MLLKQQRTYSGEESAGKVAQRSQAKGNAPELEIRCKFDASVPIAAGTKSLQMQKRSNAQTRPVHLDWSEGQNPEPVAAIAGQRGRRKGESKVTRCQLLRERK